MKVTYKYQIGQKVRFIKNNLPDFRREQYFAPFVDQEVTIIERGFIFEDRSCNYRRNPDKTHFEIFYYIAEDPWYTDDNKYGPLTRIPEEYLEGRTNNEEVDEQFISVDGIEIIPFKSTIYDRVIERYQDSNKIHTKANCEFVFATEGTCVGIRKSYEIDLYDLRAKTSYSNKEVKIAREFLTDFPPNEKHSKPYPRQDAAAKGYESWVRLQKDNSLGTVFCSIPENYAQVYVETAVHDRFLRKVGFNPFNNVNFEWEIEQWLKRYGVYDEVKRLFYEQLPEEKEKNTKEKQEHEDFIKRTQEFLNTLTPKQIKELKKIL